MADEVSPTLREPSVSLTPEFVRCDSISAP